MKQHITFKFLLSLLLVNIFTLEAIIASSGILLKTETIDVVDTPQKEEVVEMIHRANRYWQEQNPKHRNSFWNRAAYHIGNMAAYEITNDACYLDFSTAWADYNEWKGAKSDNKSDWKYTYGESDDYVLFGDYQTCFQVYTDLYKIAPDEKKIARAREVMEYQMSTDNNDYWWWADGLFMVMPVMTRLHKITGNSDYLEKLHDYWQYANNIMYDEEEGLYYRDANYVYPAWKTNSGKKDFWSRGNGWVFAAFARILNDLPETDQYRDTYITYYKKMAKALAANQQDGGYWTRSIIDPEYVPGEETSGTAFFAYGYLWGINNGYLSEGDYGNVAIRAWNYLANTALQENGKIGYVQPIGAHAVPGQYIDANSTADFGVGAFLLAASEMVKYAEGSIPEPELRISMATLKDANLITIIFNVSLDPISAKNISNYKINGEIIQGSVSYDGDRTVKIELAEALDYGTYKLNVEGLRSESGTLIDENTGKTFNLTVPLDPVETSVSVAAIGSQYPNFPQNTLDNNLDTRWSQQGYGQWIKYDLGIVREVNAIDIAFFSGDMRNAYFEIELSEDDNIYTKILANGVSSGITAEMERYTLTQQPARYVKIVCNGTSSGDWNSITETRIRFASPSIIHSIEDNQMLRLYPNPVHNVLIIESSVPFEEKIEISVYDLLGNTVMYTILEKGQQVINCSSLSNGDYILATKIGERNFHHKISKR